MANQRIDDLIELLPLDISDSDVLPIVDLTTNETKKIKYGSFLVKNNVLRYGADPTGVLDSTAAFAACLLDNGSALVPDGTFKVGDLELNSKRLSGTGTLVRLSGATYTVIMQGEASVIEGLTFATSASAVNGESEIKLDDSVNFPSVRRCRFNGTLYSCVSADQNGTDDTSLTYTNPANGFTFEGNECRGSYSRHLYLHSVSNFKIINNSFKDSARDCIRLRQATAKGLLSGNTFDDIGFEYPEIIERPRNWSSLESFSLGERVSIAPNGIFQCIVPSSTIGANPTTGGAAEWTNVAPAYFETKDILDAFWSGVELIITNNIVNKAATYGFAIKGVEPNGRYATGKIIISHNLIQNCFGIGVEVSNESRTLAGDFRPSAEYIITNNIFRGNNRERFDVAQSPITIRQGARSVIIAHNIIEGNYARGITVANADPTAGINRDVLIDGNHIISNGLPGNPSAIGLNVNATNGLIIKNNFIRNLDRIEEYKMVVAGTSTADENITFPARGNAGGSLSIPILNGDDYATIKSKIVQALIDDYPVLYESDSTYYANVREELGTVSSVVMGVTTGFPSGQIRVNSDLPGTQGDGYTIETIVDNALAPSVTPTNWTWDEGTKTLLVYIRSSTRPNHFINAFNAVAPAEARAVLSLELDAGVPSDILSQEVMVGETVVTTGGVDGDELWFDARIEEALTPGAFTGSGYTVTLTRDPLKTNSVQFFGMNLADVTKVSTTTFRAPKLSYIIKDNLVSGNSVEDRFSILMNGVEIPALLFYVDSNNTENNTIVTTQAKTNFTGGSNSVGGLFGTTNTQASLLIQNMTLRARIQGEDGNNITFEIEQQTGASQPLRMQIAPAYIGGKDVLLRLPTDGDGDPLDVTVTEVEEFIRQRCGQGIMAFEDNYINILRPQRERIAGDPAVSAMTKQLSTTQDIQVFRGLADEMLLGAEVLGILDRLDDIDEDLAKFDPKVKFRIFETFMSGSAAGNNGWTSTANSGVVGTNISSSSGKEIGIARLDTSTSSTSAPTLALGVSSMYFLNTVVSLEMKYQVSLLSTAIEEFDDRSGFHNSTTSAAPTNGAYFEYDRATYGVNWQAVTVKASTVTRTDTGVAVAAAWVRLRIVATNDTSVEFYINEVLVATNTTNIPNASANAFGIGLQKVKTAGTTARVSFIDFVDLKVNL
jgi:hypothetical protein